MKKILLVLIAIGLFYIANISSAQAASSYSVTEAAATVGSATNLEIEYTVDTALQTWADADTLTVQLPANFPQWGSLTFTAEYDTDTTNDNTGETPITAGGGNGQYSVATDTITIKWDATTWGAPVNLASTIRILVTASAVPQYADATSTFSFAGATVAADTDPSGPDNVNVSAADAAVSLTLANGAAGATQDTTLNITVPVDMANTDTIVFDAPANLDITGTAFSSETFAGAGTFATCSSAGQTITCTANGVITAGAGTIVMTGITGLYAAGGQTITNVVVYDSSAGANTATDASGTVTDTTAIVVEGRRNTTRCDFDCGETTSSSDENTLTETSIDNTVEETSSEPEIVDNISASIIVPTTTETISYSFSDIVNHWARDYIQTFFQANIISGKEDGTFAPDDPITRAEIIKIVINAFGINIPSNLTEDPFEDVDKDLWFAPYIKAAKDLGIVEGVSDNLFEPNKLINRASALKIILEASELTGIDEALAETDYIFDDVPLHKWFSKYVAFAKKMGIVSGYGDGNFGPGHHISRGEITKIISNVLVLLD